jgi:hypothetical protein
MFMTILIKSPILEPSESYETLIYLSTPLSMRSVFLIFIQLPDKKSDFLVSIISGNNNARD